MTYGMCVDQEGGGRQNRTRPEAPNPLHVLLCPTISLMKHKFKDKMLKILRWQLQSTNSQAWGPPECGTLCDGTECLSMKLLWRQCLSGLPISLEVSLHPLPLGIRHFLDHQVFSALLRSPYTLLLEKDCYSRFIF